MAKIILHMGHRDLTGGGTAGGTLTERGYSDDIVLACKRALLAAGHVPFVNQELDGDVDNTMLLRSLDWVGRNAVKIDQEFGPVDAYLSIHLEGSSIPGLFAIVPDSNGLIAAADGHSDPGDTWADNPLDVAFARSLAQRCMVSTGLGKRSTTEPGVMSERATGVGGAGWRLSEYHETEPIREHATRNILECGAMPSPDIFIISQPDFPAKIAAGVLAAVNEVFGAVSEPTPEPVSKYFNDDHTIRGPYVKHAFDPLGLTSGYNPDGPVSRVWRSWTKRTDQLVGMTAKNLLGYGYTEYVFADGVLRIIWDGTDAWIPEGI